MLKRHDIEDDQYGVFGPIVHDMGRDAAEHPDKLMFELMNLGFSSKCYDGQNFFDDTHQARNADGVNVNVSNIQEGSDPAWYLLDTSRGMRPFVYQERRKFEFVAKTEPNDDRVFMRNEFLYGASGRCNVGFGLWQLAFGSKLPLTATNYEAARRAMQTLRGDSGRLLGIRPTVLVAPTSLEGDVLQLIKSQFLESGESNIWANSVETIITPWLEA